MRAPMTAIAIATAPQMAIAGQPDLNALPDHGDFKTRKHPVDFFAPPPPRIGTVTSADSTLRLGNSHKSMAARLILAGIIGGAIAGFFFFLAHQADMPSDGQGLI